MPTAPPRRRRSKPTPQPEPTPAEVPEEGVDAVDQELILSDFGFLAWFESYGWIRDKDRRLLQPNSTPFQIRCAEALVYCLRNHLPIRFIKLKGRQQGCSTESTGEMYWLFRRRPMNSVIIGGEYSQVRNLWNMVKLYHDSDIFQWPGGEGILNQITGLWENGSALERETARDKEAGRAFTYQAMLATEAARWNEEGQAGATDVMAGILNSIPDLPYTYACMESTAAGDYGMFYDYWQDAITIEDHAAGRIPENWNGFFRLFSPWYEHPETLLPMDSFATEKLIKSLTDEERDAVIQYRLTPGQVLWYRQTMRRKCKRNPAIMKREYPYTPEEAFHSASKRRFNSSGLAILEAEARQASCVVGVLEPTNPDPTKAKFIFQPSPEESAVITQWEPPRVGMAYLLAVDVATGASQTDGDDTDHHCGIVLRQGYYDPDRGWQRPAVVASTVAICRWDIDILAHWIYALSDLYGQCKIVPEANDDRGLIILLKQMGANLYERNTDDDQPAGARSPKPSGKFGFKTKGGQAENTRNWIIEKLARQIREWDTEADGIYIPDLDTIKELKAFVVKKNGRAEAAEGKHDDRVMALAIGNACLNMATTYAIDIRQASVPRDIYIGDRQGGQGAGGAQFS